jgi:NTE family protein
MSYHFRNLVFEGGGVKGIAYLGAMEVLEEKGIMANIQRVGGTSVGAINAAMIALGYNQAEQKKELWELNFNNFKDSSWDIFHNIGRVFQRYGWNKGDACKQWIESLVAKKLGKRNATFQDLRDNGKLDLYVYGTNLCTHFGEVFSIERTPKMNIADAVRISMSIPLFFTAMRNSRKDVYVDGGCLNNYPVKLFDRKKYILGKNPARMGLIRPYYKVINASFLKEHPDSSPYIYNRETLGFRLDTKEEIAAFRYNEPSIHQINKFPEYVKELIKTMLDVQNNVHLHSDDWQRTIYIDTLGVSTTDFDIDDETKNKLVKSGRDGANQYFKWFDTSSEKILNRP